MMSSRSLRRVVSLSLIAAVTLVAPVFADDVCGSYDKKKRIERLGTNNAFSPGGAQSPDHLAQQLTENRAAIELVFQEQGLDKGLVQKVIDAVVSGNGLSERSLERGEEYEWMMFRKGNKMKGSGKAGTLGKVYTEQDVCFASKKTYDAYIVEVVEEAAGSDGSASCNFTVNAGECKDGGREVMVKASDSVQMSYKGPGTSESIPSSTSLMLGPGEYTFSASSTAEGKAGTVTTHTFVIPKICLNVSYAGKSEKPGSGGQDDTCGDTKTVNVDACLPTCELTVPETAMRKESFTVGADGSYDSISLKVLNEEGETVTVHADPGGKVTSFAPDTPIFINGKAGIYTVEGLAKNSVGESSCTERIEITAPPSWWTFRAMGFLFSADERVSTDRVRDNGVNERTMLDVEGGQGIALDLERRFSERFGLQGNIHFGNVDTSLKFDLDNDWEMADDEASFLAVTFGPNFHLSPNSKVDFYVGPFIGFAEVDDTSYRVLGETQNRTFGDDFLVGALLGLDIPFGSKDWGLHLGARFMDFAVDGTDGEFAIDPLTTEFGFFWSF